MGFIAGRVAVQQVLFQCVCFAPIPVAERLLTRIAGSKPAGGVDVCIVCVVH